MKSLQIQDTFEPYYAGRKEPFDSAAKPGMQAGTAFLRKLERADKLAAADRSATEKAAHEPRRS